MAIIINENNVEMNKLIDLTNEKILLVKKLLNCNIEEECSILSALADNSEERSKIIETVTEVKIERAMEKISIPTAPIPERETIEFIGKFSQKPNGRIEVSGKIPEKAKNNTVIVFRILDSIQNDEILLNKEYSVRAFLGEKDGQYHVYGVKEIGVE